jgi:hypothetical protein
MFETQSCKITYLKEHNAVYCQWKKYCEYENYRQPLEYGLNLINENNATIWITDTTNGFESNTDNTKWLLDSFIPKTINSCRIFLQVYSIDLTLKYLIIYIIYLLKY